jgi:lysozyme family protein
MADFNIADKLRQQNEGGYANNKADNGGETFRGIARKFWGSWKGWSIIDGIKKQYGTTAAIINKYASGNAVLRGYELEFYKTNF